jgi:arsenate reductase
MLLRVALAALIGSHVLAQEKTTVVFVCEHGAARSVIAAAYFNRLAAERHLPYHAIARGTSPQEELSVATVKGLEADGIPYERAKPRGLTEADTKDAVRLMAFCPIPEQFARTRRIEQHEDVPDISANYAAARDKIVAYVKALLDELERSR